MSTDRPRIAPAAAAALLAAVPARLVKRLDADPAQAAKWTWATAAGAVTAATPSGETVRLTVTDGVVARAEDVRCSCLLAPRCLHVAAVVSLLAPTDAAPEAAPAAPSAAAVELIALTRDQLEAAATAWRTAAALVTVGAEATGAATQASLLRAIHACRAAGLYRAAAAATRVLAQIRELRADRPEFALEQLGDDLRELLAVLRALRAAGGSAPAALIGTARRRYDPIGGLRLHGIFTDAIVARSGYAGAVTYLTDGAGRLFSVSDVAPGQVDRAVAAYDAGVAIGDATLSHRELGRSGLFVSAATASRDGRLGAGKDVKAVRAAATAWSDPAIAQLWQPSVADQLARLAASAAEPVDRRRAGWDLVFVTGELVTCEAAGRASVPMTGGPGAAGGGALGIRLGDERTLLLLPATDHVALRHRDNLTALAQHRGRRVHVIGRARLDRPRTLAPLAVGAVGAGESLVLAANLAGRVNLAFDRLGSAGVAAGTVVAPPVTAMPDPLVGLRRRIERVGLAGAATLPPEAGSEIHREAAVLERRMMPGAVAVLHDLAAAAHHGERRADGRRAPVDPERFALAWLRAAVYTDAAERRIAEAAWLG